MSRSLHELGVAAMGRALAGGQLSSLEITQHLLTRVAAFEHLGAFLAQDPQLSLAQAREADACRARGQAQPLTGVPIAHKDIFVTRALPSTAGSKMLAGYASPFDATVVARLSAAGMVTLGKLNCDEFAMGSANENSAFGAVKNPWDTQRVPGGSSGGSAAAVAARLVPAATGTDTGGSIRQPASFSGVTGIKPTYGVCSRYGMIAFASSLDQAGPLARSAEDCALLLSAMSGFDERDSTSAERPPQDFHAQMLQPREGASAARPLQGLRIGLPREFFPAALAADVNGAVRAALAEFEKLGATLVDVSLPRTELSIPVYYIIAPAEASSNLSRFDGVKFGHRAKDYGDLRSMYERSRAEGFGPEVKRRIMIGTYVLSHGYYDAYYLQAQKLRRMIADDFQACFKACDLIAGPVAPTVAWKLGEQHDDPVKAYLADIFTLPASLAGLPGMSVPAGFGEGGMPVGLQLIGNYFEEGRLLHAAHAFQQATDFHTRAPARRAVQHERAGTLIRGFEVVIGLETHAQLSTRSKIFSGASTQFGAAPNTQACAVDLALPGTLPVLNRGAVERAIRFGLAVNAKVAPLSIFARKNYFYPDLPKGYQISQYEIPVVQGGHVDIRVGEQRKRIHLTRAHLEEDAGKSLHEDYAGPDRHRPEPRRHAAAGDRHRTRHAQQRRSGGIRQGAARAGGLAGRVRRQHAGRQLPLRRQRVGAPARRRTRHAPRGEESQFLPLPAAGHRLRSAVADRPHRGRPARRAGHGAVRPRHRRDARHAQQGRRA